MTDIAGYRRAAAGTQPNYLHLPYASSETRSPTQPLIVLPHTLTEVTGPLFGYADIKANDFDLTAQNAGDPLGQRIVVSGRVLDANGRPIPHTLVEVWQANAAGRYRHKADQHDMPLDPNFTGCGRTITDA